MSIVILIQLLLAHVLTDFVFQTKKIVDRKNTKGIKSKCFWIHILLSGVLTYVLLMNWTCWTVPLFIIVTHGIIDFWKITQEEKITQFNACQQNVSNEKTSTVLFFLDQLFHLITILCVWLYFTKNFDEVIPFIGSLLTDKKYITLITSFIIVIWPVGLAIGKITEPFRKQLSATSNNTIANAQAEDSLSNAGTYIGIFERSLVLILVLLGQFQAIGFLIAAKSVLRISKDEESDARKKTEYVLIGTLISFTIAIAIGVVTNYIIKN